MSAPPPGRELRPTVVLLHGLARSARSLSGLRRHLERAGYPTWARSYPSRRASVPQAAAEVAGWLRSELAGRPLLAVTHSLGGILVRCMSEQIRFERVVMLAPPNQGSRLARQLGAFAPLRWFYGPAIDELGGPADWPQPSAPVAVIAGTRSGPSLNPTGWLSRSTGLLSRYEDSDGTVTLEETQLPSMAAFATVPASHTFIMDHPQTRALVLRFLEHGRF